MCNFGKPKNSPDSCSFSKLFQEDKGPCHWGLQGSSNGIGAVPGKFESRMPADLIGGGVTKSATELWFGCLLVLRQGLTM